MFWQVLGDIIPLTLGVILSPLPIAGVIAMLLSPRGRANSVVFALAFLVGTALVTGVAAFGTWSTQQSDSLLARLIHIVLGFAFAALFFYLAWRSFSKRPRKPEDAHEPRWMASVDSFGAIRAAGLGVLIGVANVKNLPILLSVGATIGTAGLQPVLVVVMVVLFATVASLGVLVPMVVGQSASITVRSSLAEMKNFLVRYNSIILAVLFAILGAVQLGKAFGAIG